jgi:AI-2 transport protein TqsA
VLRPIDLKEEQSWLATASLIVIAAVAGAVALAYTRPVMVPLVLAVFIFYLVTPVTDLLERRIRMPRVASVALTLLLVAAFLGLLGLLITTSVRGLLDSVDIYRERLAAFARQVFGVLDRYGLNLGQESVVQSLRELPLNRLLQGAAGTVFGLVGNGFLVLVFVIFLMLGRRRGVVKPPLFLEIDAKIRRFLVLKFAISATTGLLVGAILAVVGLDLALVFGVLAFLLNFIPSIGSIVATLLPIPVALVQFDTTWQVVAVVLGPGIVQVVIGNGIDPRVLGAGLDLSPVTILAALIFWGLLWGIVGMLLAAPITAIARIVLAQFETTRGVAEVLAGRLPGARAPTPDAT